MRVEVERSSLALVRMILVQTIVSVRWQRAKQVLSLGGTGVVVSRHAKLVAGATLQIYDGKFRLRRHVIGHCNTLPIKSD